MVIPGHGRLSDETEVANYRDMVTIIRDRIAALIAAGKTLEQVQAERPTRDYDGIYAGLGGGRPSSSSPRCIAISKVRNEQRACDEA